jgi:TolB-like protein
VTTSSRRSLGLASFTLLALLASGCRSLPRPAGMHTEASASPELTSKAPMEVAIAPVVNDSGVKVPEGALRQGFANGLIKRRYSPLALTYVDSRVTDAAYSPGAANEQAVLQIQIERWDEALWSSRAAISLTLNAKLLDTKTNAELWSGRVDRRFDFSTSEAYATDAERVQAACDQIAYEVLARLPQRQTGPGKL